ncbi:unnamed protein product [Paramecium octaurelia]|uniref:Uncharacterized protein n=1 Tax=Paramecium octaurelia TaxID=43137 RepID=A0A8S1W981_PAROT|nr:unnamed protein product [Paramecium octaurelia]
MNQYLKQQFSNKTSSILHQINYIYLFLTIRLNLNQQIKLCSMHIQQPSSLGKNIISKYFKYRQLVICQQDSLIQACKKIVFFKSYILNYQNETKMPIQGKKDQLCYLKYFSNFFYHLQVIHFEYMLYYKVCTKRTNCQNPINSTNTKTLSSNMMFILKKVEQQICFTFKYKIGLQKK